MHLLKEARFGGPEVRFGTDIVASTDVAMDDSLLCDREGEPIQLAAVDIFVCTVDPLKEPPLVTANTVLSKMCLHEWMQYITGKFIIPQISNIASIWFVSLFVSTFATGILEMRWSGVGIDEWWRNEQFWVIGGVSAHLFVIFQALLKVIFNPGIFKVVRNIELASFLRWYVAVELHDPTYAKHFYSTYEMLEENMFKLSANENGGEKGFKLWQSLLHQTELTTQLCGGTQKKMQKLRQLLSGLLSELTYFDKVEALDVSSSLIIMATSDTPYPTLLPRV